MKKKDIYLLLIVYGIIVVICTWQFVFLSNQEKAIQIKTENDTLKIRIDQLEALTSKEQEYKESIIKRKEEIGQLTHQFPYGNNYEEEIMYLHFMEQLGSNDVSIPVLTMHDPVERPFSSSTSVEGYELLDDNIKLYESKVDVTFTTTDYGVKNMLHYITTDIYQKSISTINLAANPDGKLSGSMTLEFYHLEGGDYVYTPIEINGIRQGVDNIWGTLDYINAAAATVIDELNAQ